MVSSLRKFISWAFLKLLLGAFLLVSTTGMYALWLLNNDDVDFSRSYARHIAALNEEHATALLVRAVAEKSFIAIQQESAEQNARADRAAKIAADLQELQTWYKRVFGDRTQWQMNTRGISRMEQIERDARQAAKKTRKELRDAGRALEEADRALRRLDKQRGWAVLSDTPTTYYAYLSWTKGWWVFLSLVALYFLGPTLRKLCLFYYIAPRLGRSRGMQLTRQSGPFPGLGDSRTVVETSLWPGETARVRLRYLQSAEEGVLNESRLLLSWRFPITSLLSGFVHDVNLRNARAGREYRLAFAHHKNPDHQMAVVHVPEGGSLVVRPSFLAAVILPPGQKLLFRQRWQLFRWQAWVTGQLRFLECIGPCRLIVSGRPGLRAERLTAQPDGVPASCRTPQDKIIGFTPNLEYRLIRTARFWSYYRWNSKLFDASFTGIGFVLVQTSLPGRKRGVLSATRNRARRILGL